MRKSGRPTRSIYAARASKTIAERSYPSWNYRNLIVWHLRRRRSVRRASIPQALPSLRSRNAPTTSNGDATPKMSKAVAKLVVRGRFGKRRRSSRHRRRTTRIRRRRIRIEPVARLVFSFGRLAARSESAGSVLSTGFVSRSADEV